MTQDSADRRAPVLVVSHPGLHPFAHYCAEVLRMHGFKAFDEIAAEQLLAGLEGRRAVVVCDVQLTAKQQSALESFAKAGGLLVLMRPKERMARLAGLEESDGDIPDRYAGQESSSPIGGMSAERIQYHGPAGRYRLREAAACAWIEMQMPLGRTQWPAVTYRELGTGAVVAFAFDLGQSSLLLRQGLREQSSVGARPDPDGDGMFKPGDMHWGYLDPDLKFLPQADIWERFLLGVLDRSGPYPRIWHFPDAEPKVALLSGDSDGMEAYQYEMMIGLAEKHGVKYCLNLMVEDFPALDPGRMGELLDRGHELGPHYWCGPKPSWDQMRDTLGRHVRAMEERYGRSPVSSTGHSLIWVGWADQAKLFAEAGIRLSSNFAPIRGYRSGFLCGTSYPFRFCDEQGAFVEGLWEMPIHGSGDDAYLQPKTGLPPMTPEEALAHSEYIMDLVGRYTGAFLYHPHPIWLDPPGGLPSTKEWIDAALGYGVEKGFRFMRREDFVDFVDARMKAGIGRTEFPADRVSFEVDVPDGAEGITVVLAGDWQAESQGSALDRRDVLVDDKLLSAWVMPKGPATVGVEAVLRERG